MTQGRESFEAEALDRELNKVQDRVFKDQGS